MSVHRIKVNIGMFSDKPIFSVDIHPAGKRFATGGQGGDSGRVVVWNLNSVLYESVEVDPNIPKMLCQMDNHLGMFMQNNPVLKALIISPINRFSILR